jgi:hypothetical protein
MGHGAPKKDLGFNEEAGRGLTQKEGCFGLSEKEAEDVGADDLSEIDCGLSQAQFRHDSKQLGSVLEPGRFGCPISRGASIL